MNQLRPLRSPGDGGDEARVDIAPLIDVVFLLLIFYVVASTFSRPTAVPINRPAASQAAPLPDRPLIVTLAADGQAFLGESPWKPNDAPSVRRALALRDNARVLIHADGAVPTAMLVRAIDTCRMAGAKAVDLAADQERR